MPKAICTTLLAIALNLILVSWGSKGHFIINTKCPDSFPTSMNAFKVWSDSLALHGSDADNRKSAIPTESPKHFIDIDNYTEFIINGRIFSTYDSIVGTGKNQHLESFVIKNGTLPYATISTYDSLKMSFKNLQWNKSMLIASDLGHYVADGHMPLHLSSNYDGGKTGQTGVHSRYESAMVYTYYSSLRNYSGSPVNFISNVNTYVFDYIYRNQKYVDSVLIADNYGATVDPSYSTAYTTALWSKAKFTISLFKNASHALAELIYTAWVEAGSPAYGSKTVANGFTVPNSNLSVYPNPTTGKLTANTEEILITKVCSIDGKAQGVFDGNNINISNLPNGVYILDLLHKNGKITKTKIILAK